jgi:hypothetical protein
VRAVSSVEAEIDLFVAAGNQARTTAYREVVTASAQTQAAAIGLRSAAQQRLQASWQQLQADVEQRLEAPRSRFTKAEAKLDKELRAAGKTPGASTCE